ncbi:MAG: AzlC family ABC transporter permease, partial [Hyphomicrobiaceae bacterium]
TRPLTPSDDYEIPTPEPAGQSWQGVSPARAFVRGLAVGLSVPGVILFASAAGYGALARDAGFSLFNSIYMMGIFFALPAQVLMLDQIARGGSLAASAFAVTLTGIRLLPMGALLMPLLKGPRVRYWQYLVAAHFVAVTAWIEGWRRLPSVPVSLRMEHFIGIGTAMLASTLLGTAVGYEVAGTVPTVIAAALLFLTPVYFLLSLLATASEFSDKAAIVFGVALGPPFYLLAPGFDLLLAGVIGGTLARVLARRRTSP